MIKRRFYRLEHANRDGPSDDSSSSSDSEVEAEATEETEDGDEETPVAEVRENGEASSSSGYESEDSSVNEVNLDSSGLPTSDEDITTKNHMQIVTESHPSGKGSSEPEPIDTDNGQEEDKFPLDATDCILKLKSVFKCRLCPRIVCLSEETLKSHLTSKRHARSVKLLKEGRLKLMLNSEGQIEGETDSETNDASISVEEKPTKFKKKGKGDRKHKKRFRKKEESKLKKGSSREYQGKKIRKK